MQTIQTIRDRVMSRFPSVLLTLLSIVQALALEVLWSGLPGHSHLWRGGLGAWVGWLQVFAVFLGIVVIWLFYTSLVMRILWLPSVRDSVLPFGLGVMQFVLASLLAPEHRHLWIYVMALMFGICSWTSTSIFIRARGEPENAEFFEGMEKASRFEIFVIPGAFIAMLGLAGLAIQVWGPAGGVALVSMGVTIAALVAQVVVIRGYWHRSLGREGVQTCERTAD